MEQFEHDMTVKLMDEIYGLRIYWDEKRINELWSNVVNKEDDILRRFLVAMSIFTSSRMDVKIKTKTTREYMNYIEDTVVIARAIIELYHDFLEAYTKGEYDVVEKITEVIVPFVKEYAIHIGNINAYSSDTKKPSLAIVCLLSYSYFTTKFLYHIPCLKKIQELFVSDKSSNLYTYESVRKKIFKAIDTIIENTHLDIVKTPEMEDYNNKLVVEEEDVNTLGLIVAIENFGLSSPNITEMENLYKNQTKTYCGKK